MKKIYEVTFNDGGWHSSLPNFIMVANSKEEALQKIREEHKTYEKWDGWASEFKLDGYIIEVYDKKEYDGILRDRKINKVIDGV